MKFKINDPIIVIDGNSYYHGQTGLIKNVSPFSSKPYYAHMSGGDGAIFSEDQIELDMIQLPSTSNPSQTWESYNTGNLNDSLRAKRRDAGECEECGRRRDMCIHGLLECPEHLIFLLLGFKQ